MNGPFGPARPAAGTFDGELRYVALAFTASAVATFAVIWIAAQLVELTIESILTYVAVVLLGAPFLAGIAGGLASRTVLGVAGTLLGTWAGWLASYLIGGTEMEPGDMVLPGAILAILAVGGHLAAVITVGVRRR